MQRSESWIQSRIGHVTGSRFHDICAVSKRDGKPLKGRADAISEIALEILTGKPGPMWTSKATDWGNQQEPFARIAYEAHTGELCEEVDFIRHPRHPQIGASPDGLIGTDGGWEAKCPYTHAVHMQTLLHGMPDEHIAQVQGGMFVTGRQWWDFVSFHPDFPPGMQLYIQRVERDQAYIDVLEDKVLNAVAEINVTVRELLSRYGEPMREAA